MYASSKRVFSQFFYLSPLGLGIRLGFTVDLEPPHLLHQARHVVEKLFLAGIVHLQEKFTQLGNYWKFQGGWNFMCF